MFTTLTFLPDPPISDSPLTYSYILSFPTLPPEKTKHPFVLANYFCAWGLSWSVVALSGAMV